MGRDQGPGPWGGPAHKTQIVQPRPGSGVSGGLQGCVPRLILSNDLSLTDSDRLRSNLKIAPRHPVPPPPGGRSGGGRCASGVCNRCPSAVQALSKHCPSLVQADHFCVQARLGHTPDPLCFCHFEVTKSLPKFPFYNIKRDQDIKNGGQNRAWPPAGQAF